MQVTLVSADKGFADQIQGSLAKDNIGFSILSPGAFSPGAFHENPPDLLAVEVADEAQIDVIQAMRCRQHLRKIPLIALLSHPSRELTMAVHQAGVRDILSKQGELAALLERIKRLCPVSTRNGGGGTARLANGHTEPAQMEWSDPETTAFKKQVQREVSRRLEMLPSLPIVVMEVMQLVENEKSSAMDFEEHISHDQAMAARILRIANSSFFAQTRKIKSIRDAIVVLGFRTLKSVVMAASTGEILNRPAEGYGYQAGGLWKHSIACAVGSRLLARKLGRSEAAAEELFVQGLLHDIGKLLLNHFAEEKVGSFREAIQEQGMTLAEAETTIMGINHMKVGARIAERWNLPGEVQAVIEYHHNPRSAGQHREAVALVHAVNYLCHEMKIGMIPDSFVESHLVREEMEHVGISEELLQGLTEEFTAQLNEMEKLFSMIG